MPIFLRSILLLILGSPVGNLLFKTLLRGSRHVYESVYDSAYDFMHNIARKLDRDPILDITLMVCLHNSAKKHLNCGIPLAANRTLNRTPIRTQNRTCRRLLNLLTIG
jgi:hypothetical protein